jgi:hypothetical protein
MSKTPDWLTNLRLLKIGWTLHPCTDFRALENGLDDFHIGDSVLNRCWNIGVVEDGLGEGIALQGVLVAGFYLDLLSLIAVLIPDFAGLVGRSVEGYLDLNPIGIKLRRDDNRRLHLTS